MSFQRKKLQVGVPQVEHVVPEILKADGFYAIKLAQAEMYDPGNIKYIPHFIIYDRKERIAVDVTSDFKPAPLLSKTQPAEVLPNESVEVLEDFLTGKEKPIPPPSDQRRIPRGISCFRATELGGHRYEGLRARMVELRDARLTLDNAIEALRTSAMILKSKYLTKH